MPLFFVCISLVADVGNVVKFGGHWPQKSWPIVQEPDKTRPIRYQWPNKLNWPKF